MCESYYIGFDLRHSFKNFSYQRTNFNTAVFGPFSMLSRVLGAEITPRCSSIPSYGNSNVPGHICAMDALAYHSPVSLN